MAGRLNQTNHNSTDWTIALMRVYAELVNDDSTVDAAGTLLALLPQNIVAVDASMYGSLTLQLVAAVDDDVKSDVVRIVLDNLPTTV